jgi:2-C-methyl-D-erythritol 2,4-cyclodiphosphate synthase
MCYAYNCLIFIQYLDIRPKEQIMRVGIGYDIHRLVKGRPLILGGVSIAYEKGLLGHSDADVLTHAICDALLGAGGLGDILPYAG